MKNSYMPKGVIIIYYPNLILKHISVVGKFVVMVNSLKPKQENTNYLFGYYIIKIPYNAIILFILTGNKYELFKDRRNGGNGGNGYGYFLNPLKLGILVVLD
jgi:GTPase SAR1 family protein